MSRRADHQSDFSYNTRRQIQPFFETRDGSLFSFFMYMLAICLLLVGFYLWWIIPDEESQMLGIVFVLLFLGILAFLFIPEVYLKAYPDQIEIRFGITKLIRKIIPVGQLKCINIIDIRPLGDFGGIGITRGKGRYKGWLAYIGSYRKLGVAIETTNVNYFVSCPNAEEAVEILREKYNLDKIQAEN